MDRIVIVTKPTRLEELIGQYMTEGAAQFALESRGQSFAQYQSEHANYMSALAVVRGQIPSSIAVTTVTRSEIPNFLFRDTDLVLVCGPDGLFVNVAKYIGKQLVLTVNPDPDSVAGVLMLFKPAEVRDVLTKLKAGTQITQKLPFVRALIDGERKVWGLNDIFIGRRDQISARYKISFAGRSEEQSSSGIIVATGVGSTGWMSSIVHMLNGLTTRRENHRLLSLPSPTSEELVFVVREPFLSPNTGVTLMTGRVTPGNPLTVISEMPEGGAIFSDGVVEKASECKAGSTVVVTVGDRHVTRIVR